MHQHAGGNLDDQLVIDAVCMRLSAGVEALSGLDAATRDRLFDDAWPLMWGMRNRIAHGYLLVDAEIVRRTLEHDIPPIVAAIEAELTSPTGARPWTTAAGRDRGSGPGESGNGHGLAEPGGRSVRVARPAWGQPGGVS
jgi:uncharacterized protein with HEPN domain